ncbi:hypothetical protein BAUCODRAFT_154694 [Baudoinia panamericana UAMH 10762]|uniref:Midasin n=1 Tax=Baudoinia panamericana (strain UAMH 10762) TaxID=717646 RepID=M2NI43_BAUPA|nr:uncharacterized protein BAUCODRAFT_154694 [Baudoinia panamericana UAMH 10762]EMC99014.1 hypothetical protein BAUCODRAFT_154694 [Baudoinia panamericana UAMH 10762]
MECLWDNALLQSSQEMPPELLDMIQHGSNVQYLEALTRASLDARYTDLLFAHCEHVFAHISASLRQYGSLAATIATMGRIVPFAPYLSTYATRLLRDERHALGVSGDQDEILLYLLGLYRLLRFEPRTYKQHVDLVQLQEMLRSPCRAIVYMAIRIFQICLNGADHWFEKTLEECLGEDTPDGAINGQWDDKTIDYRFLTLWEEDRYEKLTKLIDNGRNGNAEVPPSLRSLDPACFHPSTALVGGVLFPRADLSSASTERALASGGQLVDTHTVASNLKALGVAFKSPKPVLLAGLAGSGKTLVARHAAQLLGKLDNMVTLHLNEQSDAKLLVGIYTTGETPGSFSWKSGVLTTAVQEGRWVLIEDLDRAPHEIIGMLLPLIEKRELQIPNRKQTIYAAEGFRILATVRSSVNAQGRETNPLSHMLGARHWQKVTVHMPPSNEQRFIAQKLYPSLAQLLPQLTSVYDRLVLISQQVQLTGRTKTGMPRSLAPQDLLKWCKRVKNLLSGRPSFTTSDIDNIFMEGIDCFVGALPEGSARSDIVSILARELRIDPRRRDYLLGEREIRYGDGKAHISIGRYTLHHESSRRLATSTASPIALNAHTVRMLERVTAAVVNREPLLLVGETGVGKTTAVQHLAKHLGKKLEAFNLSQQSEASDLLGGFKPVSVRSLVIPMKDEFDELFAAGFSISKNRQFLDLLGKQMAKSNWKAVCKLWRQALKMVSHQEPYLFGAEGEGPSKKRKLDSKQTIDRARWRSFSAKVEDLEKRLSAGSEAFAFSFVEGNIVKAVRNGDWVLLDEINLATPDTLESIVDLFSPVTPSLLLTEAGNIERIEAHPDFRVFAAMNPATDIGKKDLPPGIRSRFTELYVEGPDKDLKSLQNIVQSYLRPDVTADPAVALDVGTLYQKIIALAEHNRLVDGAGQKPHFSLRTFTRTLSYAKHITPQCNLRRALYEGFHMSFLTFLNAESAALIAPLVEQHLFGKRINTRAESQKALHKPNDGKQYVQGYPGSKHWVHQGRNELEEQAHYILTPFIKSNLENLVRAASTRQFPVLIQGPTSSGKTSMIEYLAKRTGHTFVRINNHEHTDLQEYLGTYVSGTDGRLQFQEGILVRALREGHWVVLDELNLAPTDVLEALNRLLDDNRELLIPETQETVRPHEDFMLFATQNPAGLYGGRKTLSRAFRNRFLELHFDDIPIDELQEILHRRTQLPESRCKRIVTVYRELSILRQQSRMFEQKSFATLRDLFRWAMRPNETIDQLAANGYMLLAERVRKVEERAAVKQVIEKVLSLNGPRVTIDEGALYAHDNVELRNQEGKLHSSGVVWTKAMRRLYTLVARAIANDEPVLLVGETGCGKTTVCQMLALALGKALYTVNAHQNTETGDLIGSQRPVRDRASVEATLRHRLLASPPLQELDTAAAHSSESLLIAYDCAVASMPLVEKQQYCASDAYQEAQLLRARFKALFEWADGALVQAMKSGAFFLLDEISLADDSVLERINSVLEPQRSILLAEKGSIDASVTALQGFQFFATMNPGGDYGKRELSPALRNRFTEIWVPAMSETEDVAQIMSSKLVPSATRYAGAMVAFAQWFKQRFDTTASSSVSVRDALAWVEFVNTCVEMDTITAIVHGAAMVYIDTLGANPAGLMTLSSHNLAEERSSCLAELGRLIHADTFAIYGNPVEVVDQAEFFSIGPFAVRRRASSSVAVNVFTFGATTTRNNAMRVLRAMRIPKPVLLEGSPGVGKTALITAISDLTAVPLTRINLSEQTDLLDLFGSDVPVEGTLECNFAWREAPFLRAMRCGEWVLLDEMNLASQSVLEGLNACLDHRGEVFVPELGLTFTKHPEFRLFAAQNPHSQGGGRKGLPASFVNRFTVVYADAFQADDLALICRRGFPSVGESILKRAITFLTQLDREVVQRRRFGSIGSPWEFNLRDLSRWLSLHASDEGLIKAGNARDFVSFLFCHRFRSAADRALVDSLFDSVFEDALYATDISSSISYSRLQLGLALLPRDTYSAQVTDASPLVWTSDRLRILESLMLSVQQSWPVLLVGSSGNGKTTLIEKLACTIGASVSTISLNAETDAMDLIGGYEQADSMRQNHAALADLRLRIAEMALSTALRAVAAQFLDAFHQLSNDDRPASERLAELRRIVSCWNSPDLCELFDEATSSATDVDRARFEWHDGPLIEALKHGKWLILDNANLCSSSVLDRLNSLLEADGALIVNEHVEADGSPRIIRPHANFRIFLTADPRYGELSRAMRNRTVELFLPPIDGAVARTQPLYSESAIARLRQIRLLDHLPADNGMLDRSLSLAQDHTGLSDRALLSRFAAQLSAGLYSDSAKTRAFNIAVSAPNEHHYTAGLYSSASVTYAKATADFASVQTIHPLNNQALVSQNPALSQRALMLTFVYDVQRLFTPLLNRTRRLKSDAAVTRQFDSLARVMRRSANANRSEDGLLAFLEHVEIAVLQWLQELAEVSDAYAGQTDASTDIQKHIHVDTRFELRDAPSRIVRLLASSVQSFLDMAACSELDAVTTNAWLLVLKETLLTPVIATSITGPSSTHAIPMSIGEALSHQLSLWQLQDFRGSACTSLWKALRPLSPPTMAHLQQVECLKTLMDRFDKLVQRFDAPLAQLLKMRAAFAEAWRMALTTKADTAALQQQLEALMPAPQEDVDDHEHGEKPHFHDVFQDLCGKLAIRSMSEPAASITANARVVEMLALRPTYDSASTLHDMYRTPDWHADLALLAAELASAQSSDPMLGNQPFHYRFFQLEASIDNVSLQRFALLENEVGALGFAISANAAAFCEDDLLPLNQCLRKMLKAVLNALAVGNSLNVDSAWFAELLGSTDDSHHPLFVDADMSKALGPDPQGVEAWVKTALQHVFLYLNDAMGAGEPSRNRAANAWALLGASCLTLYIPRQPFDPALMSTLESDVYQQSRKELEQDYHALTSFDTLLTGTPHTLRSRCVMMALNSLGPAPVVEQVCRPAVSEMDRLTAELEGLLRLAESLRLHAFSHVAADEVMWTNLARLRLRLQQQYRAYADFTGPIIGFVDCLRMARRLLQTPKVSAETASFTTIAAITPFSTASWTTWLSDEAFIHALSATQTQQETLYVLHVLATRSFLAPIRYQSLALLDKVDLQFIRFYDRWKATLDEDQRRNTAKSSLYRYQGGQEMEAEILTEELAQLFPDGDDGTGTSQTSGSRANQMRDTAYAVSRLHHSLFTPKDGDLHDMVDLLRQYARILAQSQDPSSLASCIPAMLWNLRALTDSISKPTLLPASYNIYTDGNVGEVKKLVHLVTRVRVRFDDLHLAWPEHATPLDVVQRCSLIFQLPHNKPLTSLMVHLEKLYATVAQWQQVASREYSAGDLLDAITNMIISWRQLELASWAGLLQREDDNCKRDASSWWFIAFENIILAFRGSQGLSHEARQQIQSVLQTLEDFIANCGLGEFDTRLAMLRDFANHVELLGKDHASFALMHQALANFIAYFSRFEYVVAETLRVGRSRLEKDIRNVMQVASWKDRNVDVLRQSAKSSHGKLLRQVRKYRALLSQPVRPLLQGEMALNAKLQRWNGNTGSSDTAHDLASREVLIDIALETWQRRPARFINVTSTVSLMRARTDTLALRNDSSKQISTFAAEVQNDILDLQRKTPSTLTDHNKAFVQHLKTQKRRLLADVLKTVRLMGFQANLSDEALSRQATLHVVLAIAPALDVLGKHEGGAKAELSFHSLLSLMPNVRESARKHSEDLTGSEANRCLMLLESMLQTCIAERSRLVENARFASELEAVMQRFNAFAFCDRPTKEGANRDQSHLMARLRCLKPILETCTQLVDAQASLAERDYTHISQAIRTMAGKASMLEDEFGALPPLLPGISNTAFEAWQLRVDALGHEIDGAASSLVAQYPETEPILCHLTRWTVTGHSVPLSANGYLEIDAEQWTSDLLAALDVILSGMQSIGQGSQPLPSNVVEESWLTQAQKSIHADFEALKVKAIVRHVTSAVAGLSHVAGNILPQIAAICRIVLPIVSSYNEACRRLLDQSCTLQVETTRLACQLARSFLQLAQRGFCTPPEKAPRDEQKGGDVESGTGLGEGEGAGAEDVSKDIADNEDLSELAQEPTTSREDGTIEDEKDAVDMADEEMEGEFGEDEANAEDEEGAADAEADRHLDEEAGSMDDEEDVTVDEKMWDDGPNGDIAEKETNKAQGTMIGDDRTAGQTKDSGSDSEVKQRDAVPEEETVPDEEEHVQQATNEQVDPHAQDQSTLENLEDVDVDGQPHESDTLSEMDDVSDGAEGEQEADAELGQEASLEDSGDHNDAEANDIAADAVEAAKAEADGQLDGEEEADEQLDGEEEAGGELDGEVQPDVLMAEREAPAEQHSDTMFGESGEGADQDNSHTERAAGVSAAQDETTEGEPTERPQNSDAGSTGVERGRATQDVTTAAHKASEEKSKVPYKQIGDILDEWYKQQRQIQAAEHHDEDGTERNQDVDMADANFEHLPDSEAAADTQALGTASAEQSRAIDEDRGLPVNEQEDATMPPTEEEEGRKKKEDADTLDLEQLMQPSDALRLEQQPKAFVGEPKHDGRERNRLHESFADEEQHVQEVDQQLTKTHLDPQETTEGSTLQEARSTWSQHENSTRNLALIFTEHLRLVLHPTQATKMRGDFRTGKRLNIKRIIPYIASSYKRDKIWMRRSVPTKRSYQVMLAIDDSKSMAESGSKEIAFDTVALLAKALSMLEVGELSVVGFGENVTVAHDFGMPFTSEAGAQVVRQFGFTQTRTDLRKLLAESIELFRSARLKATGSASELWQLQLIVSDGICEDHPSIRQLVRRAHGERIMVVFIVVDAEAQTTQASKQSILDLQTAEFTKDEKGEMQLKMVKYLDTFPFRYYLIVRDVQEMPAVLAGALRQWFAEVVETAGA